MRGQINSKVLGATVVGLALVLGTYTISNFGKTSGKYQPASVQSSIPSQRVAIEVVDSDQNGIEDWRDEFVTTEAIVIDKTATEYTLPDTLTGKMSINLMDGLIRSRIYAPFSDTDEEVVDNTVDYLIEETQTKFYDTPDIIIMSNWDDEDVVNYSNTLAATLEIHSIPELESELEILQDILDNNKPERVEDLLAIAGVYRNYRDDTLKIPVPAFLVIEHLNLINTYNSMIDDIEAMAKLYEDPATTLLRVQQYQEDTEALWLAFQNIFFALEPFGNLFSADDPAILFVIFSPDFQI